MDEATRRTFSEAPTISPAPAGTGAGAGASTPAGGRRSLAPVLAMATGLVVIAMAGALIAFSDRSGSDRPAASAGASMAAPSGGAFAADPSAITLSERDVSVVVQMYEPGHDTGWHTHPGIHAVAVVSGAVTVYDGECRPTTYGPGQPYVGGRDLHLVRNESSVPAELSVTYLSPSVPGASTQHLAAPAGCMVPG